MWARGGGGEASKSDLAGPTKMGLLRACADDCGGGAGAAAGGGRGGGADDCGGGVVGNTGPVSIICRFGQY